MFISSYSGLEMASSKAAHHRIERGVWTIARFGDMRRALAGVYNSYCAFPSLPTFYFHSFLPQTLGWNKGHYHGASTTCEIWMIINQMRNPRLFYQNMILYVASVQGAIK